MQGSMSLDLLGYATGRFLKDSRPLLELPTWSPDWRAIEYVRPVSSSSWPVFSAVAGRLHITPQVSGNASQLRVRGMIIDEVEELSRDFEDEDVWTGACSGKEGSLFEFMEELGIFSETAEEKRCSMERLLKAVFADGIRPTERFLKRKRLTSAAVT